MHKIFYILLLICATTLRAELSDSEFALLENLTSKNPFGSNSVSGMQSINAPEQLSLRSMMSIGGKWYFSLYDPALNASYWIELKGESTSTPIKADFFDPETNSLNISNGTQTYTLTLKDRDPLIGPVPQGLAVPGARGRPTREQAFQRAITGMTQEQKIAMALQLSAELNKRPAQQQQQNRNPRAR